MNGFQLLTIAVGLSLGLLLGRVLDRSRFTLATAVPARGRIEAFYSVSLALALVWFALGIMRLAVRGLSLSGPSVGIVPAAIGGLVSGLALGYLGACPLVTVMETGHLRAMAAATFAGWVSGIIIFFHSPAAALVEGTESVSLLTLVHGIPGGPVFLVLGAVVFIPLLQVMVNVYPGLMEWPKTGAWLAGLTLAGWWLGRLGGDSGGLNAVPAVRDLASVFYGDGSFDCPVLCTGIGIVAYGVGDRLFVGRWKDRIRPSSAGLAGTFIAGCILGAGNAIAGGDPAAHVFFGVGSLGLGSAVFTVVLAAGIYLGAYSTRKFAGSTRGKGAIMNDGEIAKRIWAKDVNLWHSDPVHHKEISIRLGWLTVATEMREKAGEIAAFAQEVRKEGFRHAFLLGMGGSSLAPEVFNRVFGPAGDGIGLTVLDTTDPAAIAAAEKAVDLGKTLFIVSSKSGGTIEVDSLLRHFLARTGGKGRQFIAITDPDTKLGERAAKEGFRRVFVNPSDIGGRYSVLSYFGLVPAALIGVDVARLLDSALTMMKACGTDAVPERNPGLALGLAMGRAAQAGRDKVTLVLDPKLAAFGLWIEQLLAESTGKEGKGLVPVDGEPLAGPKSYGNDRFFVSTALGGGHPAGLAALEKAGHPVFRLDLGALSDLGGEFFRWEFATVAAGAVMGIDPFDQPNVKEAKDRTAVLLETLKKDGRLPDVIPSEAEARDGLKKILASLAPGRDYLGILAFCPFDPATDRAMAGLRLKLREKLGIATTFGYGPRYLHSTGQLHKGGADNGAFIVITCDHPFDLPVPEKHYSFAQLQRAQALGDLKSLEDKPRRVVRVHASPTAAVRLIESLL
jgi:glucose-6-phosphate isomerase/transaldolase/glucose-6-phosphate isomerase